MINEYWLLLNKNKQYRDAPHEKKDNLSEFNFDYSRGFCVFKHG